MPNPIGKQQYRIALRRYIKSFYRENSFRVLLDNDDDDDERTHLRVIFDDNINHRQSYEGIVIDLIEAAKDRGKYDKLVMLLKNNNPNFERDISKYFTLSSEQSGVASVAGRHNNDSRAKSIKVSSAVKSSVFRPMMPEEKNVNEAGKPLPLEGVPQNIERLGANITLLGEIGDLLEGLRGKIGEVTQNLHVQHQTIINVARRPNLFPGKQKSHFQVNRSSVAGQQSFSSPGRGRKEMYPKP